MSESLQVLMAILFPFLVVGGLFLSFAAIAGSVGMLMWLISYTDKKEKLLVLQQYNDYIKENK